MRASRPRLCLYRTASGSERMKKGGQAARHRRQDVGSNGGSRCDRFGRVTYVFCSSRFRFAFITRSKRPKKFSSINCTAKTLALSWSRHPAGGGGQPARPFSSARFRLRFCKVTNAGDLPASSRTLWGRPWSICQGRELSDSWAIKYRALFLGFGERRGELNPQRNKGFGL